MFELPKLSYSYDALEPHFDARTMELHHSKHHQAYVDKLNAAVEKYPDIKEATVEDLLKNLNSLKVDDADRTAIRNNGGGHFNHSLFWKILDPASKKGEMLETGIISSFGSVDDFKKQFTDLALKLFGSGWVWLGADENGKYHLQATGLQDSPLIHGHTPILGLDLWEHSYYLKFQSRRAEYIEAWWKVLKLI